jgi:hypothetical protein
MLDEPTGCSIVAEALNRMGPEELKRRGLESKDGKPWTEEKLEAIYNGMPPSLLKLLHLLVENEMPLEYVTPLIEALIDNGGFENDLWYNVAKRNPRRFIESWCLHCEGEHRND